MTIPSHFYLYGMKIKVKYSSKIDGCGLADYPNNTIYLSTKMKSKEILEIALEGRDRCKRLISPKELKELIGRLEKIV